MTVVDPNILPDPRRSLLLTIDVQCDFTLPGALAEIPGTFAAVPNMIRLAASFRASKRPIVHMIRLYREDGSNVDLCRKQAVVQGWSAARPDSNGAELVSQLAPLGAKLDAEILLTGEPQQLGPQEWALYKPRWGAFYRTALEEMIWELGVNTLVVCGCNFPNCPRTSIYEASERDLRVMVVEDALSGLYPQGRQELLNIGVQVNNTDTCLAWLT